MNSYKGIPVVLMRAQPYSLPARDPDHHGDAAVDIGVGGGPGGDADPHGGPALPDSHAAPTGTVFLKFFDDALRHFGVAERNEDLVEHDVV
jgi:hypothetical protein